MSHPSDHHMLGLSRRARRLVVLVSVTAVLVIVVGSYLTRRGDQAGGEGPVVGGDLHAVGQLGDRLFVGGHGGAGYRASASGWTQINSLKDKDVMGWAATTSRLLAGGHEGLYASTDQGSTFSHVQGIPVSDVHGLGAIGSVIYLASPQAGVLVSTDGGSSFEQRGSTGQDFMGTIWVDPSNPKVAIAPSMHDGAVKTTDGGSTWTPLGSETGTMAVAVNDSGNELLTLGMNGAQRSLDAGATWHALDVPDSTSAAAYSSDGNLIVAALSGDRASVYERKGAKWDPLS